MSRLVTLKAINVSLYVDNNRFATNRKRFVIFTDLSELISVLSQADCM